MTLVPKNGYSYTGYTEPFIVPTGTSIANSAVLAPLPNPFTGVTGAVDINFTEFRNAGLFVRFLSTGASLTHTTKDINFDGQARMQAGHGKFVVEVAGVFATVDDVVYDVVTELYTVTLSAAINPVIGTPYKVVARVPDTNGATATKAYAAGEKVIEEYP